MATETRRYTDPFPWFDGRPAVKCVECSSRATAVFLGVDEIADHDAEIHAETEGA
jgi:hypothetical protein